MTTRFALASLALAVAAAGRLPAADPLPASGKYWVFLGTYTGKGGSQGVYRAELDAKNGKLTAPELAVEARNPSFLAFRPDGKVLLAVGEFADAGAKKDEGQVASYTLDGAGRLHPLDEIGSGGAGPCHVAVDHEGRFAVAANYGDGSCAFYKLGPDGAFAQRVAAFKHAKEAGGKPRQPHGHCGGFDATGTLAFVCDLGLDQVLLYRVDRDAGTVTPNDPPFVTMPAGSGPRHLVAAPGNDVLFVNGETDSTLSVVQMDPKAGKFAVTQTESTLPGGKPVKGNSTAEVRLHPSGKFVYVSNRGHNSIAAFRYEGGKVTPIGHATEGIKVPRNFNITPDGRWMLVANQDGNDVLVFEVGADGLPKPTGNRVELSKPVCVKFLPKP